MPTRFLARLDTPAGRVLRYLISILLVAAFVWSIDWRELASIRGQFSWSWVIVAGLLAGLIYPLHAWRWWLLLRAQGLGLSLHWAHVITWIGQFYNGFLLGGLGGDAARIYYVCRDEPEQKAGGLASIVLDRVMGLVVLMSLAVLAFLTKAGQLIREPGLQWLFPVAFSIFLGAAAVAWMLVRTNPSRWPPWLRNRLGADRIATITQLLTRLRNSPRAHAEALILSYGIWLLDFVAVWLFAHAVGLSLPFLDTCIAMSVGYAATALPISVGGHGVREGALLVTLGLLGLLAADGSRDRALLLAVLIWATTVFWSLIGGVVLLLSRSRSHQPS